MQVLCEGGQLGPATFRNAGGQIQGGNGQALNFTADAGVVIREAHHVEVACQVSAHHGVQTVDVLGAVLGAPFHADDVALSRLRGHDLGLIALFDRLLLDLGALDLTARCQALIAQDAQCFDFRALAAAAAVLQDLKIAGSGHAVF